MRWTLKPKPPKDKVNLLIETLKIDALTASLLVQRGIETYEEARNFFRPSLDELHNPFLMKDMDKAVDRILKAIDANENILVYGDYDVDGTTSVALVSSFLSTVYPNIANYIPDRYDEGYGISYTGIDFAEDNDFSLIIALDCGIKAIDKVDYASEKGIDFIICDHHTPGDEIPSAIAVLDPKRKDCEYPFKELCGCGVGFKLVQALASKWEIPKEDLIEYLDLVATAIGADIVPITGENRILAFHGLEVINTQPRPGFQAIINQIKKETLTITDVVFIIAPRINAAGRMKHGNYAVTLLTETDLNQATQFAIEIEQFNTDRRDTDKRITEEALTQIIDNGEEEKFTTVVFDPNWHKGVIGIVASRLTETYYRPTLVFTKSGEKLAASARSVKGFNVYEALDSCSEYLEQFGGHKYAAGLTMLEKDYPKFKEHFEKVVSESINPQLLQREILIDSELNLNEITPKFYRILKQFAPFGPGNMTPVFMANDLVDIGYGKCVGEDKSHLRVTVQQHDSPKFTGIGFGLGDKLQLIENKNKFNAVFNIDENEWQGRVSLQLKLKDLR